MSAEASSLRSTERGTLRDGFAVLGVAIRREPWVFTLSTLGSVLFGALTVADAWVLGWSTDNVVLPAFDDGDIRPGGLLTILALFVGVAILRAVGIVARRLGAGVMQYRMQAHYRRDVTRQYLRLPMSWHQQHPTGQLLSNANSDVEAAWAPIAPLPMAVGTVAMMVIAVGQMLVTDLVLAVVGLLVFPVVIATNVIYQRFQSPLMTRAQALRAELSEVAHESFDGALVVKTLGRETEETERFAKKAHQLRDVNVRAGRIRAAFDPVLEALPSLGVLAVLAVGVLRVDRGLTDPGNVVTVAYLLTIVSFPIRSLGWLVGEFPRSVVGFDRVQTVLDATGEMPYGDRVVAPSGNGARLDVRHLGYRYADGPPLLEDLTFSVQPGRTVAVVGATASGKSTLTSLLLQAGRPGVGERCCWTGPTCATWRPGRWPSTWPWCPSRPSSSTTRSAATSHWAPTSPTRRCGGPCGPHRPTGSWPPCPTGSTPGWGSAARPCPVASASGSPWPAPWCAGPGCW